MTVKILLVVLTAFISVTLSSPGQSGDDVDTCSLPHAASDAQAYIDGNILTAAGSYIPRELYWSRPQYTLAPCFQVDGPVQAIAGCKANVRMNMDAQCANALFETAGQYTDRYHLRVMRLNAACDESWM